MGKELSNQEKQTIVMERVAEELVKCLRSQIPEKGIFRPYGFTFDVYGTENKGMMQVEYKSGADRMLKLGVLRKGTDRFYSHFLPSGTNQDLIAYLEDPNSLTDWLDSIKHLSDRVDDYWD